MKIAKGYQPKNKASHLAVWALFLSLIAIVPVAVSTPASAATGFNQYPGINESQIVSTATISAAVYNSTPQTITYTTSRNVFASSGQGSDVGSAMYVQIRGLTNGACTGLNSYNSPTQAIAVSAISYSAGFVTYSTSSTQNLIANEPITITGATTAAYNGTFNVTSVNSTTSFTVKNTITTPVSSSNATGTYVVWQRITAATDYSFTIAKESAVNLTACPSITGQTGNASARASGLKNQVSSRTSVIATDGTGSVIVMSTGSKWPLNTSGGYLYISKNSGASFSKVDFVDSAGVPHSATAFTKRGENAAQVPFDTQGYRGCQHIACQWNSVSVSNDGQVISAASYNGQLVYSKDGGTSWVEVTREGFFPCLKSEVPTWQDVKVSRDGTKIFAAEQGKSLMWFLDLSKPVTQITSGGAGTSYGLPQVSVSVSGNTVQNAATDTYSFAAAVSGNHTLNPATNGLIVASAMYPSNQSLFENPGAGSSTCNQSVYSSQTNPSVISPYSADKDYLAAGGRIFAAPANNFMVANPYAIGISGNGQYVYLDSGFNTFKRCQMSDTWATSKCQIQSTAYGSTLWSNIDVRSIFASASGQYVTVVGFQNAILVSTNYGVSWTNNASAPYSSGAAHSPTCQNPYGVISVAGSDDGRTQTFVTTASSYTGNKQGPGICSSTNYGVTWAPTPVGITAGSTVDISRDQQWTSVAVGSSGKPLYFGSASVNAYSTTDSCTQNTYRCWPNFWASFGISGPGSLGTPVGTAITGQVYTTVNPPSGSQGGITYAITSGSRAGITIGASSGSLVVANTVPVGIYSIIITATDTASEDASAALDMKIYVYDPSRSVPLFDTPVKTSDGFTVNVTNYDANYQYFSNLGTPSAGVAAVSLGTPTGATQPITVSTMTGGATVSLSISSYMGNTLNQYGLLTSTSISNGPTAAQTTPVVITNNPAQVPTGGVVATTLTASGGDGTGAYTFATSTANCTVVGNQLKTTLSTGATCSVTATRLGDGSYSVSSASSPVSFTATAAGIVPTFDTPVPTASGFTVNITNFAASTTFTPTISPGSVSAGTASGSTLPLTVTGLTTGQSAIVTVTTTKASTTTQFSTVASHALYTSPSVTAVLASVSVGTTLVPTTTRTGLQGSHAITSVTYSYSGTGSTIYGPSATAPTAIGTYSITPSAAVFSPLSAASEYNSPTYTLANFSITALTRTISFTSSPSTLTYNVPVTVTATPSAGAGTVTYTSSDTSLCTISGNQVTAVSGSGSCTVTATIASDGTYASATVTSASITLAAASRTLNFTSTPSTLAYGQSGSVVAAVGLGSGTVSYSAGSSTACSVGSSTGAVTVTNGAGTCQISATVTADGYYSSVSTVTPASITITLGTQATLTITSVSTKGFANSYTLASSGGTISGAVTYSVSSTGNTASCSVTGTAVTTTGAVGTSCVITATMAGNANYQAVSSAGFTLTIVKSSQAALSITSAVSKPFSSGLSLTTSGGTGGGLISFAVTTAGSAGCSISGTAPNFSLQSTGAVGTTCGLTATSAQTTNYTAINSAQVTFTVIANKSTPPLITSVSPGNNSVTVSWTAPSDLGGSSQIDLYTVTSSPGGYTCTTATTSCTVAGLSNGTSYTFTVTASTTAAGASDASPVSSLITPVTKAAAVTGLIVTTGDQQLTLNWLAVTDAALGGGTFTSYLIYFKTNTATSYGSPWETITDSSTVTSVITGLPGPRLVNGTAYDVKVVTITAANATEIAGNAAEALQTPAARPSAPRNLTTYSADGLTALVNWQTPLTDGGDAIDEYLVSVTTAGSSSTCTLTTLTSTRCTLSSLTRGTTLAISVKAKNALMGEGLAATTSYLLPNVPGAPTWGTAVASPISGSTGNAGKVALNWVAPVNDGTRVITSYFVKTINLSTYSIIDTQTVFSPIAEVAVTDIAVSYGYLVYGINEIGDGVWSETLTVTTTLPGSVTFGAANSSSSGVVLNVTVGNNGGSPITGFLYSLDGINYTLINSSSNQLTIPGLVGGATYQIYVKAVNSIGQSVANSISVVVVQTVSSGGGGGGGGGGGFIPSGLSQSEIDAAQKIAIDKALADKAIADKILTDKAAVAKAIADKLAADKLAAEKVIADKLAAEKAATDKAIADKLAADKSAAAAAYRSTCNLAQGTTAVFSKSSAMKIYSQVCFVPDVMKPLSSDLAQVKKLIQELKNRKIQSITLSSFADEKSGVNFKSVAQARADVVASMIKKAIPKMKITYRLFGSSTKKNSLSLGRVVITA